MPVTVDDGSGEEKFAVGRWQEGFEIEWHDGLRLSMEMAMTATWWYRRRERRRGERS
ncbi:hypothetical protein COCNU_04G004340 [Cocos nucifera]|uniref:Uncharacterized protein n=1 Tax=Cocos nucifera TaxID=13894 RepID=A0A8K0I676_COCNU|nr:hypothetical protein COCNU_04G004340 [Cocos nucifera]